MTDRRSALVLGANGFIGRHVCRHLQRMGVYVQGVGHGDWRDEASTAWGLDSWHSADITLPALACSVMSMPDAVIHCAGSGSVAQSYEQPLQDFERSVASVTAALEFARSRGGERAARVVVCSSAAVYGDQGDVDLTETSTRSPVSPYGFHKVAAESLCDSYARFFNVPVSIVRLFSVYGNGLRKQLLWDAAAKFRRGESRFFGTGHEWRDWIHVEDAAALLCSAAFMPQARFEIYNGGHHKATTSQVLSAFASHFPGSPRPTFTGENHTGNPRRLTADSGHARRQLAWQPAVELHDGLEQYAQWVSSGAAR